MTTLLVITGLVPVIPITRALRFSKRDGRDKAGHDVVGLTPSRHPAGPPDRTGEPQAREGDRLQDVARFSLPLAGRGRGGGRRVRALPIE
jgi:hypothetical protein